MWAGHTLGELSEERLLDFDELRGLDDVQDLLQLVQEHHLLWTVSLRPELQQPHDDLQGQRSQDVSLPHLRSLRYYGKKQQQHTLSVAMETVGTSADSPAPSDCCPSPGTGPHSTPAEGQAERHS